MIKKLCWSILPILLFTLAGWRSPVSASQDPALPAVDFGASLADNFDDAGIGLEASAGVWYLGGPVTEGPAALQFAAYRFSDEDAASDAMPIILAYFSEVTSEDTHGDLVSVSAIGDEQLALVVTREWSTNNGDAYVSARTGDVVIYGHTYGGASSTINPLAVIVPYLSETAERISTQPHESDEELRALLPTYDTIPGGFTELEAPSVDYSPEQDVDDSAEPDTTPDELVQTAPDGFNFTGSGDLATTLTPIKGAYTIKFNCSTPGGVASLYGGGWFDETEISATGTVFTFEIDSFHAMLLITCEGDWLLSGVLAG